MLCACAFQLPFGKIFTFYTPKYVFLITIVIFEIGSALCGAAPNSVAFIVGRAIAGLGSAGIMSGGIILMLNTLPLAKRPIWMGLFGAVFGVSSVIGPLLGGAFTTDVTWRWCFYSTSLSIARDPFQYADVQGAVNLPIGGVALAIIAFILKPAPPQVKGLSIGQKLAKLDLLGELFLLPCIICLLLGMQWGGSTYAWSDGRIIALFTLFGALLIAFALVQVLMPATATIPASIIANRNILAGMMLTFCIASTMMALVYFIPTWLQAIKGQSAVKSGISTIPMVLGLVIANISAGQLTGRIGYYTPSAYLSVILMPIGAGLISTWNINTGSGKWIGYQILLGLGVGAGMQQGNMAAQTVLTGKDVPLGVALMMFCQQLGGAIFVSVGQNVFSSKLVGGLTDLVDGLSAQDVVNTGATELRLIVPADQLAAVLSVYNAALRQVFVVGVAMACLAAIGAFALDWRSVKGKQGPAAAGKPVKAGNSSEEPKGDAQV